MFSSEPAFWKIARQICLWKDGDLIVLDDKLKLDEFQKIARSQGLLSFHLPVLWYN